MPKKGYKQTQEHVDNRTKSHVGWRKPNKSGWIHQGRLMINDGNREILLHRYLMEQFLGRRLNRNEIVHHINFDPLDNRIENLRLMTRSEHSSLHNNGKNRSNNGGWHWSPGQRERYLIALKKRHAPTEETKRKISDTMKRIRKERYWSSRK